MGCSSHHEEESMTRSACELDFNLYPAVGQVAMPVEHLSSAICKQESVTNATARHRLTCCLTPAAWHWAQAEDPKTQQGAAAAAALKHCWSVWHTHESQ